ncbi:MAG TPA: flagellar motor protein MotD [Steroidobacteraceae bacterium]|nr:flagellar motor protein MotD [Steroidobacteraceae bacterium]
MARKKKHEEHLNHEAWAIPYGDLVTLLFALFTVMYAMSSVNEGKYRVLSDSLVAAFRGAPKTTTPITVEKASSGKGGDQHLTGVRPTALMKLRDPRPTLPGMERTAELGATAAKDAQGHAQGGGTDPKYALFKMADDVRKALQGLIDQKVVNVRQTAFSLEVEIKTDILFPSGVAAVSPGALPVLTKIAEILKPFPNAIRVEGHTDNRPISTSVFPSNWELSAARAANVVQLFSKAGVDPLRMEVLGLGEFRPVAPNDSADGRNSNRRVVIVVLEQKVPDGGQDPVDEAIKATVAQGHEGPTVLVQRDNNAGKDPT